MKRMWLIFIVLVIALTSVFLSKRESVSRFEKFEKQVYKDASLDKNLLYRLCIPDSIADGTEYPLLVYLHGGGARGSDNKSQLEFGPIFFSSTEFQERNPCFIVAPQCPKNTQWLNIPTDTLPLRNYKQSLIPESDEMKMLVNLILSLCKKHPVDKKRIYITGISMGGSGTWDVISRYPDLAAAALILNGVSDPSQAKNINHIPIWVFHGANDNISSVDNSRKMVQALKEKDGICKYTELASAGHNIEKLVYSKAEVYKWLFAQSKNK